MDKGIITYLQREGMETGEPERGGSKLFVRQIVFLKLLLPNNQLLAFARGEGMGNRAHDKVHK